MSGGGRGGNRSGLGMDGGTNVNTSAIGGDGRSGDGYGNVSRGILQYQVCVFVFLCVMVRNYEWALLLEIELESLVI